MIIAAVLFIAVVAGTAVFKIYERRQDVLYGPYVKRTD